MRNEKSSSERFFTDVSIRAADESVNRKRCGTKTVFAYRLPVEA